MKYILLTTLTVLTLVSCKNKAELDAESAKNRTKMATTEAETEVGINSQASKRENLTTAEAIAYANGLEYFDRIEELKFTFNVKRGDNPNFARAWTWNPKTQDVTMMTAQDTVMYNRAKLDSISTKADQSFINDKYWLHAPFNLVWDEGTTLTEEENQTAPISGETMNMLTITYNNDVGYTPGDAYDLYYDGDFMVKEWVFRKGNQAEPSMMTTWEDYKNFNGVKFAETHKDSSGTFKLYFTDIALKMKEQEPAKTEEKTSKKASH